MKVYISADIEGVCGIENWNEASKTHAEYRESIESLDSVRAVSSGRLSGGDSP